MLEPEALKGQGRADSPELNGSPSRQQPKLRRRWWRPGRKMRRRPDRSWTSSRKEGEVACLCRLRPAPPPVCSGGARVQGKGNLRACLFTERREPPGVQSVSQSAVNSRSRPALTPPPALRPAPPLPRPGLTQAKYRVLTPRGYRSQLSHVSWDGVPMSEWLLSGIGGISPCPS